MKILKHNAAAETRDKKKIKKTFKMKGENLLNVFK